MEDTLVLIEEKIKPYLEELSLDLVDIEYVREGGYNFLRLYVESLDRETNLDDCVLLSSKIDPIIEPLIDDKFYLEVSTPGLERKLRREKDFLRFLSKKINVKTKSNILDQKSFEGILLDFKENIIKIKDDKLEKEIEVPFEKVKVARLVFNFSDLIFGEEVE